MGMGMRMNGWVGEEEWETEKPPNQTNEIESNKIERLEKTHTTLTHSWERERMKDGKKWIDEWTSARADEQHTKTEKVQMSKLLLLLLLLLMLHGSTYLAICLHCVRHAWQLSMSVRVSWVSVFAWNESKLEKEAWSTKENKIKGATSADIERARARDREIDNKRSKVNLMK